MGKHQARVSTSLTGQGFRNKRMAPHGSYLLAVHLQIDKEQLSDT